MENTETNDTSGEVVLRKTFVEESNDTFADSEPYYGDDTSVDATDINYTLDSVKVVNKLIEEKRSLALDLKRLWRKYIDLLKLDQLALFEFLEEKYFLHFSRMVKMRMYRTEIDDLTSVISDDTMESFDVKADEQRIKYNDFQLRETARGLPFIRRAYEKLYSVVIFEEAYTPYVEASSTDTLAVEDGSIDIQNANFTKNLEITSKPHLVFLLHGYLGAHEDMEKVFNVVLQKCPNARIHAIRCVSNNKTDNIEEMGEMVADEMMAEIEKSINFISRITLVAHSLGGLIFRSALPHLCLYKELFHTLITLGTPHLGYFHSGNRLLSLGMWVVGGIKGTPALKEIRLLDSPQLKKTTVYKLSKGKGLNWFKNVILVGSTQDFYSPIESALIQMSDRVESNSQYKNLRKMQERLADKLSDCNVHRLNLNFLISEGSIDTYIGRKAHIQFIDNSELLKMLVYRFRDIF